MGNQPHKQSENPSSRRLEKYYNQDLKDLPFHIVSVLKVSLCLKTMWAFQIFLEYQNRMQEA